MLTLILLLAGLLGTTEVAIPMRDGETLAADVYLPEQAGSYPAIVVQTPYDKRRFGRPFAGTFGKPFDDERYAWVVVDWRGFYASSGAAKGPLRSDRGEDGYDVIEWVASQPWCNGKVGTYGPSALGLIQFETAQEHPPHLVCCMPAVIPMGRGYGQYYEQGVMLEAHVQALDRLGFGVSRMVERADQPDDLAWKLAARRQGEIDVPVLLVTGWFDHYPADVISTFEKLDEAWLLIGPWTHSGVDEEAQGELHFPQAVDVTLEAAKKFFAYWLLGETGNGWTQTPRVRYFRMGENAWVEGDSFPGVPAQETMLHLNADGRLTREQPAEFALSYRHDPKSPTPTMGGANMAPLPTGPTDQSALIARDDVLSFTTGPLERELAIVGAARVELEFSVDRVSADFAVRLCKRGADGRAMLMCDAIARTGWEEDGAEGRTTPGERGKIEVVLPPVAVTVAQGEEIVLLVSSSNWPRFERNTHAGLAHWEESEALPLKVEVHGGRLVLGVVAK